jgi:hypothetical protein
VAGSKTEDEVLRQVSEMWDAAKGELAALREAVSQVARMGEAKAELEKKKSDRDEALRKLGEAYYKLCEDGQAPLAPPLKRAVGEVKAKEAEVLRQQADIAAILKEADALAEKSKKPGKKRK